MVKVKNVQSGIVIIADAGIKLAPGGTADITRLTSQAEKAIQDGLLVRVDAETEPKQKTRTTAKTEEQAKSEAKSETQSATVDSETKNGAD